MNKKTLVLGASLNPSRYSYLAVQKLDRKGHDVIAVGKDEGAIGSIQIQKEMPNEDEQIDTVTLYLNPTRQEEYYDSILALKPKRILFNPGTENPAFEEMAEAKGIATEEACTLVLLNTGQY